MINSYKQLLQIYPMMCVLKNAYKKFNLQVYADHGGLFTIYPINIVTNMIQMVWMVEFQQYTGWLVWVAATITGQQVTWE